MLTVAPSPVPYPSPSNGVMDSWTCTDVVGPSPYPTDVLLPSPSPTTTTVWARTGEDCAVTHYSNVYPAPPANVTVAPGVQGTADPAGYTPGDTGNWNDLGPWWAAVIAAACLAPFAFLFFVRIGRRVLRHV